MSTIFIPVVDVNTKLRDLLMGMTNWATFSAMNTRRLCLDYNLVHAEYKADSMIRRSFR